MSLQSASCARIQDRPKNKLVTTMFGWSINHPKSQVLIIECENHGTHLGKHNISTFQPSSLDPPKNSSIGLLIGCRGVRKQLNKGSKWSINQLPSCSQHGKIGMPASFAHFSKTKYRTINDTRNYPSYIIQELETSIETSASLFP